MATHKRTDTCTACISVNDVSASSNSMAHVVTVNTVHFVMAVHNRTDNRPVYIFTAKNRTDTWFAKLLVTKMSLAAGGNGSRLTLSRSKTRDAIRIPSKWMSFFCRMFYSSSQLTVYFIRQAYYCDCDYHNEWLKLYLWLWWWLWLVVLLKYYYSCCYLYCCYITGLWKLSEPASWSSTKNNDRRLQSQ